MSDHARDLMQAAVDAQRAGQALRGADVRSFVSAYGGRSATGAMSA